MNFLKKYTGKNKRLNTKTSKCKTKKNKNIKFLFGGNDDEDDEEDEEEEEEEEIVTRKKKTKKEKIPKIVHQIWFGSSVPQWRKYLFDHNKEICKKCGYKYILWTEDKRKPEFFESTHGYQRDAIKIGEETGQSRWAQVADLARLEIVYKMGGIYIDSLFEISTHFLDEITRLSNTGKYIFIGANEDPCRFDCKGNAGRKYLTNSFFAGTKGCPILERLLTEESLEDIDLSSPYINRTTGPYYLRSAIKNKEIKEGVVHLFETEQIFPFNVNPSDYREVHPNTCLKETDKILNKNKKKYVYVNEKQSLRKNCLNEMYFNPSVEEKPLAIYHSGLGGTWSYNL